ncbi:hypothetical protein OQA88_968 [Cercophora sp. LCS_1]
MHPGLLPILAGIASALSAPPIARQEPAPVPAEIHLAGVIYAGSGCPAGSMNWTIASDPAGITMNYTTFTATTGKNIPATEYRKNCQLNVKLKYSSGWQWTVAETDYRGNASIPEGVVGTAKSTYYFSGAEDQMEYSMNIKGPYEGEFLKKDQIDMASSVWSRCGSEALFNINTQVRFLPSNLTETATLSLKSLDKVAFRWKLPKTSSSTQSAPISSSANPSTEPAPTGTLTQPAPSSTSI